MTTGGHAGRLASTDALQQVLTCTAYERIPAAVLAPLGQIVNATSSVFVQFRGIPLQGDLVGQRHYVGVGRHAITEYSEGLYALDPMVQPALEWLHSDAEAPGTAVSLLSDIEGWRDQAYYRRFLERFGIGHVLAAAITLRTAFGPQCLCLGFHRGQRDESFSADEVDRLREFVPALAPVLSNLAYREAAMASDALVDAVCESRGGVGFLVVDEDLRVRHASRRGLQQLGLGPDARNAPASSALSFGELRRELLALPPATAADEPTTFRLPSSQREPRRLTDIEVRSIRWVDGRNAQLLTMRDASADIEFESACRKFGLSGRECEVATLVGRGYTSANVARELGIAPRTVENHLRAIYAKVRVTSRTQLVAQLLGLN